MAVCLAGGIGRPLPVPPALDADVFRRLMQPSLDLDHRQSGPILLIAAWLIGSPGFAAGQPANDSFVNATSLSGSAVAVTASDVGATKETGEPNHAGDSGGHSVRWRWTSPFTGRVIMDTAGSDFDTLLAVYRGGAVNALALVSSKQLPACPHHPFGCRF